MAMKGVAEDLRAVDTERLCPTLNLGGVIVRRAKTQHCHTPKPIAYDKFATSAKTATPPPDPSALGSPVATQDGLPQRLTIRPGGRERRPPGRVVSTAR